MVRKDTDDADMLDTKSRLRPMIGDAGIAKLDEACVAVVGLGGVGSSCVEALVRGGIGSLVLIDGDSVAASNINRQAVAYVSTIGKAKTEVMAGLARDIDPHVDIISRRMFVAGIDCVRPSDDEADSDDVGVKTSDAVCRSAQACAAAADGAETCSARTSEISAEELFADTPRPDFIVDAIDAVSSKIALALYAQRQGIPIVSSAGAAQRLDPFCLRFADLYETKMCPLCRAMRAWARKAGIEALPVLYSFEPPQTMPPGHLSASVSQAGDLTEAISQAADLTEAISQAGGLTASAPQADDLPASAPQADEKESAGSQERKKPAYLGTMSYLPPIMGQMLAGYVIRHLLAI